MIKALWVMAKATNLSLEECRQHWFEVHGQLHVSQGHKLLGYIQHHTLFHAYGGSPKPTHDGASIVWVRDTAAYKEAVATAAWQAASKDGYTGVYGGRALFEYPIICSVAEEHIVTDGLTNPLMVKAIYAARRNPELSEEEFRRHWLDVHGPLCARVPGLRRYVQNHGLGIGQSAATVYYDGWSELWFDDIDSFHIAAKNPQWIAMQEDARAGVSGKALFHADSICLVVGRERHLLPEVA
jgi:uncharacterized protein (TIGR02118 family)